MHVALLILCVSATLAFRPGSKEYKKFKITLDDTVTMKAARAHLQQIAKENKWQLSLV